MAAWASRDTSRRERSAVAMIGSGFSRAVKARQARTAAKHCGSDVVANDGAELGCPSASR